MQPILQDFSPEERKLLRAVKEVLAGSEPQGRSHPHTLKQGVLPPTPDWSHAAALTLGRPTSGGPERKRSGVKRVPKATLIFTQGIRFLKSDAVRTTRMRSRAWSVWAIPCLLGVGREHNQNHHHSFPLLSELLKNDRGLLFSASARAQMPRIVMFCPDLRRYMVAMERFDR